MKRIIWEGTRIRTIISEPTQKSSHGKQKKSQTSHRYASQKTITNGLSSFRVLRRSRGSSGLISYARGKHRKVDVVPCRRPLDWKECYLSVKKRRKPTVKQPTHAAEDIKCTECRDAYRVGPPTKSQDSERSASFFSRPEGGIMFYPEARLDGIEFIIILVHWGYLFSVETRLERSNIVRHHDGRKNWIFRQQRPHWRKRSSKASVISINDMPQPSGLNLSDPTARRFISVQAAYVATAVRKHGKTGETRVNMRRTMQQESKYREEGEQTQNYSYNATEHVVTAAVTGKENAI